MKTFKIVDDGERGTYECHAESPRDALRQYMEQMENEYGVPKLDLATDEGDYLEVWELKTKYTIRTECVVDVQEHSVAK